MSTTMNIPVAALNQHIALVGKTGSGKTYAAKGIVESLLRDERQVCVLDPTSAWWGLRLAADGKSRGFDVVLLGGDHADIPLAERSGAAVARLVTEQGASVVIDTGGMGVGQYTRWFIDFASTLYTTIKSPLHLVIDEAHNFMPQGKVPDPDTGRMLHAGNRLMSGGRSRGIRGMLITQRPQKLHKDSLTCADTLIALRVMAPQDRGAVEDWIEGAGDPKQAKTVLESLANLQKGEGWVWYPEGGYLERLKFPKIKTYDSSAAPIHGDKPGPKVSEINLSEVKAALADAVKEAEANDPKLLRQRIAELERQAKAGKPAPTIDQSAIDLAVSSAIAQRDREFAAAIAERDKIIGTMRGRIGKAQAKAGELATLLHLNGEATPAAVPKMSIASLTAKPVKQSPAPPARQKVSIAQSTTGEQSIGKCERAILQVLAQFPEGCEIGKLALLSGYCVSGGFRNSLSALRTAGMIEGENTGTMTITPAGESAGPFEPLPTGPALADYWLTNRNFGKCERAILAALIDQPHGLNISDLASATGYEVSGGFRNSLSTLRTAGVLVGRNTETMKASDELF